MRSICFVHKDIGDLDRGGICVSYKVFINEFKKLGWEIYCITQQEFTNEGITIFRLPLEKDALKHSDNVKKILDKLEVDIIEAPNYKFELLSFLRDRKSSKNKAKVVIRCNPSCTTLLFDESLLQGEIEQASLADSIISVSNFTAKDIETIYKVKNDAVVYEGIELTKWRNVQEKDVINSGYIFEGTKDREINNLKVDSIIKKDRPNIFWAAKPTSMKGYDYLTDIIKKFSSKYNFIINSANIDYKTFNEIDPTNISILRSLDRSDQLSIWSQCDLTLITSRVEGFCYVAAESLLLGKPILANSQCSVLKEFPLQNRFQYFDPNNLRDFETKIASTLKNDEYKLVHELNFFSSSRAAKESEDIYLKLLGL